MPIKHLNNWFEPLIVTKKREDISNLIKSLISQYNSCSSPLPEIQFPTKDGELIELPDFTEEHANFEEENPEEMKETVSLLSVFIQFIQDYSEFSYFLILT